METTNNLDNKLSNQNFINSFCFAGSLIVFIVYVFWISKQISERIETPIERLIQIFNEMNLDPSQIARTIDSAYAVSPLLPLTKISEIIDLLQSKDAIELYETFSNLVKLLNFTANELLIGDPS